MSNAITSIPFIVKSNSINVYLKGKMETVDSSHPNFNKVKQALIDKQFDLIEKLVNIPAAIRNFTKGSVKIENGVVYYQSQPLHNALTSRILAMSSEGFPFDHMLKFLDNLYLNPSKNSVEQLYNFLEHKNLPITEDGHFLAYKAVRKDYFDKYSGTLENKIGAVLEMPRNNVCDDYRIHCQSGLHCGAIEYVKSYGNISNGDRVVIVKVNPADAVSVPDDHAFMKLRVSKYTVIDELKDLDSIFKTSVVITDPTTPVATATDYDSGYTHGKNDAVNNNGYETQSDWTPEYVMGYENGYDDNEPNTDEVEDSAYSEGFVDYVENFLNTHSDPNTQSELLLSDLRDSTPFKSPFSKEVDLLVSEFGEEESLDFVFTELDSNL